MKKRSNSCPNHDAPSLILLEVRTCWRGGGEGGKDMLCQALSGTRQSSHGGVLLHCGFYQFPVWFIEVYISCYWGKCIVRVRENIFWEEHVKEKILCVIFLNEYFLIQADTNSLKLSFPLAGGCEHCMNCMLTVHFVSLFTFSLWNEYKANYIRINLFLIIRKTHFW